MMAHCHVILQMATGEWNPPYTLIGKLLGRFFRVSALNGQPQPHNTPTLPGFRILEARNFAEEKTRLVAILRTFQSGQVTKQPHAFFGHLTPEEWGVQQYGHVNHHLSQFGV